MKPPLSLLRLGRTLIAFLSSLTLDRLAAQEGPVGGADRSDAATACVDGKVYCIGGWGPEFDWAHPNASVFVLPLAPSGAEE